MKDFKSILVGLVLILGPLSASAVGVCDDPLRDSDVCYRMRHLRSQVNLLEAQRDLMQVNYSYLESLGEDMKALTDELVKNHNSGGKLDGLVTVQDKIDDLIKAAKMKDSSALAAANQIHQQCTTCHSSQLPASGFAWKDIASFTWGSINLKCNEERINVLGEQKRADGTTEWNTVVESAPRTLGYYRNPYRCKNMHGMFNAFEYFLTAEEIKRTNYQMTGHAAQEIARIAKDLYSKKMVHKGANNILEVVEKNANELVQLANQNDPTVATKRVELVSTCMHCHSNTSPLPTSVNKSFKW